MLLYHGTNEKAARAAIREGIRPRGETGHKGNWEHSSDSRDDCIYLSAVYAPYFAACSTDDGDGRWAVIEINTDRLDDSLLLPDEDYLEQGTRKSEIPDEDFYKGLRQANGVKDPHERMLARTAFFRDNLDNYWDRWEDSVDGIGNCCMQGGIPPYAITRVSYFAPDSNPPIYMMALDPTITLMNYAFLKPKYEALTAWFMGEDVDPALLFGGYLHDKERMRGLQEALSMKGGLEVQRIDYSYSVEVTG